jgi:hypothetical protein
MIIASLPAEESRYYFCLNHFLHFSNRRSLFFVLALHRQIFELLVYYMQIRNTYAHDISLLYCIRNHLNEQPKIL